ncbi:MAG: hypothetical protein ACRCYO_14010 [Bacteroidia bacterium]
MNPLNQLKHLINIMSPDELRLARKYVDFLHAPDYDSKSSQLLNILLRKPDSEEIEIRKNLKETVAGLTKLVERLIEKLGHALSSEFNMGEKSKLPLALKVERDIYSKLIQVQIYRSRGATHLMMRLLNQMVNQAVSIEHYELARKALYIKRDEVLIREGDSEAKKIEQKISYYEGCEKLLMESNSRKIKLFTEYTSTSNAINYEYWEQELVFFESASDTTKSDTIAYLWGQAKTTFSTLICDYTASEREAYALLRLVKSSLLLNKPKFIGIANLFIAQAKLYGGMYASALDHLDAAKQKFPLNSYNYCLSEELEFHIHFFDGNYDSAEKRIKAIIQNPAYTKSEFLESKKEFLLACCLFAKENYQEAMFIILRLSKIQLDKGGWNLGIRILKALIFIETDDYDNLLPHLVSYERDLMRVKKKETLRKRELVIYKLFNDYAKHKSFTRLAKDRAVELELLAGELPEYRWHKHGHELIPVHLWIIKHVELENVKGNISKRKSK